ncbi:MAG: YjjW family glycine radical enzyme activase, partial [Cetobacterium somerae]
VDGPGNRMAIFFQGCNFNCEYCHNPETINICKECYKCVETCPTKALEVSNSKIIWKKNLCCECDQCTKICGFDSSPKVNDYTVEDLLVEISKVKAFIKGITVSGGESTLQYKFVAKLFSEVKKKWPNLTCFVDTNGSLNLDDIEYKELVENTDFFMLDVKAWDNSEHLLLTEKEVNPVIKNLYFLRDIGKLFEVRSVIVANRLNNRLTVENVAKAIFNKDIRYKIIKYRHFGVREEMKSNLFSPTSIELEELEKLAQKNGAKNTLII